MFNIWQASVIFIEPYEVQLSVLYICINKNSGSQVTHALISFVGKEQKKFIWNPRADLFFS